MRVSPVETPRNILLPVEHLVIIEEFLRLTIKSLFLLGLPEWSMERFSCEETYCLNDFFPFVFGREGVEITIDRVKRSYFKASSVTFTGSKTTFGILFIITLAAN